MEENKIKLSKKDVWKAFLKWTFFSHSNYNYERLQASGILQSMSHIPEKLYPGNKEEQKKFMQRHMSFYNTEPHFGGIINGMVLAMEEERANGADIDDDAINNIKTGLMGPMAGIGDTLWQGTLQPIALGLFGVAAAAAQQHGGQQQGQAGGTFHGRSSGAFTNFTNLDKDIIPHIFCAEHP